MMLSTSQVLFLLTTTTTATNKDINNLTTNTSNVLIQTDTQNTTPSPHNNSSQNDIVAFLNFPRSTKRESYPADVAKAAASYKENESINLSIIDNNNIKKHGESYKSAIVKDDDIAESKLTRLTPQKSNRQGKIKQMNTNGNNENLRKLHELHESIEQRDIDDAVEFGLKSMNTLFEEKQPIWYKLGLYLDRHEPGTLLANFGKPNEKAMEMSRLGYASLEASKKVAELYTKNNGGRVLPFFNFAKSRILQTECPLRGNPRCKRSTRRFRTPDGTCNNFQHPWWGSAFLPLARFIPPVYGDGVESIRSAVSGNRLPSARDLSVHIFPDRNIEAETVTLMLTQWGQFLDHDITSTSRTVGFNGSIPRCCERSGEATLPAAFLHPACMPIEVSEQDWFFSRFNMRCLEFIRNTPSPRQDCDLGWREQMNQVTSYIDGSNIYGTNRRTMNDIRTFSNGKLQYGRQPGSDPPDPPGGELCRSGGVPTDCFTPADGRFGEQPGLVGLHTLWIRYHNRLANTLGKLNKHWSDEKLFQETRRIIGAVIQHITYREYLPIVVGSEVMDLFELRLRTRGYYQGYHNTVNPSITNEFSTAAFRFGHSMVPNSYVRFDNQHRPIFNNVTLHEEPNNFANIFSVGSLDRLILGFANQPSQKRDEFMCNELTSSLFRSPGTPFGLDLAAVNIQRGRDHGLPPYTAWREPCGLTAIQNWDALRKVVNTDTFSRLQGIYENVADIDLFVGGLAEKPIRGALVGPTFGCIIGQQFLGLRNGDRFWYENGGFQSSFTPAQLQQIRRVRFAEIICQTMGEVETIQPFVFLTADNQRNRRVSCNTINGLDLAPWTETVTQLDENVIDKDNNSGDDEVLAEGRSFPRESRKRKRRKPTSTPSSIATWNLKSNVTIIDPDKPLKIPVANITLKTVDLESKYSTYNRPNYEPISLRPPPSQNYYTKPNTKATQKPLEVNIKIQYYPPNPTTQKTTTKKRTKRPYYTSTKRPKKPIKQTGQNYNIYVPNYDQTTRPYSLNRPQPVKRPTNSFSTQYDNRPYDDELTRPDHFYNTGNKHSSFNNYYSGEKLDLNHYISDLTEISDKPVTGYLINNVKKSTKRPYYTYDPYHNYDSDYEDAPYLHTGTHIYRPTPTFYNRNHGASEQTEDDRTNTQIFGQSTDSQSTDKFQDNDENDQLDFKTRFVYRKKGPTTQFVKISSVKGEQIVLDKDTEVEFHVAQQRDDDVQSQEPHRVDESLEAVEVVDLDVTPSMSRWLIYNASEDEDLIPSLRLPEIHQSLTDCSDEIPRQMTDLTDI